ncbi:MAG: hypothetical protein AB1405_10795 [Bdellovibrionota bacterium]
MNEKTKGILAIGLGLFLFAAACGDEGGFPGIYLGEILPTYSAQDIVDGAQGVCNVGACDGEFDTVTELSLKGMPPSDMDLYAARVLPILTTFQLGTSNLDDQPEYWDFINQMQTASTAVTLSLTESVNCNSTDTGGPGIGTDEDGTMERLLVFTGTVQDDGDIDFEEPNVTTLTVTFRDCLIAGDLLDLGTTPQILVNGSLTRSFAYGGLPVEGETLTGSISLATDLDGDGTFDDPFWGENMDADASYLDEGGDWDTNGGLCIGSEVDLGTDDEDDDDDGCATDGDSLPEGFIHADYCGLLGSLIC